MTDISHKVLRGIVGEPSKIIFNEAADGGYLWQVEHGQEVSVGSEFKTTEKRKDVIGANGRREFLISAGRPGEYSLTFKYGRPWEAEAEKEVKVTFSVAPRAG